MKNIFESEPSTQTSEDNTHTFEKTETYFKEHHFRGLDDLTTYSTAKTILNLKNTVSVFAHLK